MAGTGAIPGAQDRGTISVRLLGAFGLDVDGIDRSTAVAVRARSLLAYVLLAPGVSHPRQRIAFALWPDSSEGQARTNLRNVLHNLRRSVPELEGPLTVTAGHLRWVDADGSRVDLVDVLDALDAADAAPSGSPAQLDALRRAVAVYRGDLLPEADDEWLDGERRRLRDRVQRARRDLVRGLVPIDPRAAVEVGRDLVRLEPLDEEHHQLLIAAHAAAGDRTGAVRAFHGCVDVLAQELGVEPSPATVEAYERLLAGPGPGAGTATVGAPATGGTITATPQPPLVGREDELARLVHRWREAAAGHSRLVVVRGEPGVGKTRLVDALCSKAGAGGGVVARARSYVTEGEIGYGVASEWLRTPALLAAARRAPPHDRVQLGRLVPEVAPGAPAEAPVEEGDRLRLFEAVGRTLAAVDRPVLLFADDVHWCDAASLQLLHYVLRAAPARLLVVATARPEAGQDTHPLLAVTRGLEVLDRATTLVLERLGVEDTGLLASALGVAGVDAGATAALYRETEGNPLFVIEAVRAGWRVGSTTVDLSPKLQAVIGARLGQLSDTARHIVGVAATVGRAFRTDVVARATGLDELEFVRGLDELWRHGVVEGHGPEHYDFTHGKVREAAYGGLGPAERQHNHQRIADALESVAGDGASTSGLIATHLEQAGEPRAAVAWYRRAVGHAVALGAQVEATRLLDRGLELLASLPAADARVAELALLELAPAALSGTDGYASDRLAGIQRRAVDLAAELGVDLEPPVLKSFVMSSLCRDDFDGAAVAAERLHATGTAAGDESLELESTYLLGVISFWAGQLDAAIGHFETVVRRFDPRRHPDHVSRFGHDPRPVCLSRLANALWFRGRTGEAVTARDEALAMAAAASDFITGEVVHIFGAVLSLDLDDLDAFRRCAAHFAGGQERLGVHGLVSGGVLGFVDVLDGRADAGIARIERSLDGCGDRNPAPSVRPMLLRYLVAAHAAAGDPAGGLAAADRALAIGGTRLWEPEVRRLRARFLAATRRAEEVAAELDRATEAAEQLGATGAAAKVRTTREQLLAV